MSTKLHMCKCEHNKHQAFATDAHEYGAMRQVRQVITIYGVFLMCLRCEIECVEHAAYVATREA